MIECWSKLLAELFGEMRASGSAHEHAEAIAAQVRERFGALTAKGDGPSRVEVTRDACPECGSTDTEWRCTRASRNCAIADGRLRMHDVSTAFVLGCNECSATVRRVNGDDVARWMTETKLAPGDLKRKRR